MSAEHRQCRPRVTVKSQKIFNISSQNGIPKLPWNQMPIYLCGKVHFPTKIRLKDDTETSPFTHVVRSNFFLKKSSTDDIWPNHLVLVSLSYLVRWSYLTPSKTFLLVSKLAYFQVRQSYYSKTSLL